MRGRHRADRAHCLERRRLLRRRRVLFEGHRYLAARADGHSDLGEILLELLLAELAQEVKCGCYVRFGALVHLFASRTGAVSVIGTGRLSTTALFTTLAARVFVLALFIFSFFVKTSVPVEVSNQFRDINIFKIL